MWLHQWQQVIRISQLKEEIKEMVENEFDYIDSNNFEFLINWIFFLFGFLGPKVN